MTTNRKRYHHISLDDDTFFKLKEYAALLGYKNTVDMAVKIFDEYIERHNTMEVVS